MRDSRAVTGVWLEVVTINQNVERAGVQAGVQDVFQFAGPVDGYSDGVMHGLLCGLEDIDVVNDGFADITDAPRDGVGFDVFGGLTNFLFGVEFLAVFH